MYSGTDSGLEYVKKSLKENSEKRWQTVKNVALFIIEPNR